MTYLFSSNSKSQVTPGNRPEVVHNKVKRGDPSHHNMGSRFQVVSRDSIPSVQNFLTIHQFLDASFNKALENIHMRDLVEILTI